MLLWFIGLLIVLCLGFDFNGSLPVKTTGECVDKNKFGSPLNNL